MGCCTHWDAVHKSRVDPVCSNFVVSQPFNHTKQLVMLRLSSSHLIRNFFSCHFCLSDPQELRLLRFLQQITSFYLYLSNTFPSVVTHTGFRISS